MNFTRMLSTRLMAANLLVLATGAIAFAVTFRLLASEIFDDRIRRGRGGVGGPGGPELNGQGLLSAFSESVDIALLVSLLVGVIAAGIVAWFVTERMTKPIEMIRSTTRAIADGNYSDRVGDVDVVELDALGHDVNHLAQTLEDTEERRARLLSDVTHELRTPLSSIDGFVEGAADGVFTIDETHEAVTDETARLLRLVEDLSVLSKTAEHSLSLEVTSVQLSAVAATAVDQLRPQYADRSITVDVVTRSDPEVKGDERRLIQIISNLLANALGHIDEGGSVQVVVDDDGGQASVSVIDDGAGIRDEDLDRVFDRFFRGTNAEQRSGTGLGLPVARGIAEAHGGSLAASSQGPGHGATFTLSLPSAQPGRPATVSHT
jgi:signal transduction histidine kinase